MLGEAPTLKGTDNKGKMSKSAGNAILLSDDAKTVAKKVKGMYTDPNRVSADVPGNVDDNPVFQYHDVFNPNKSEVEDLKTRYREGRVGDAEVKDRLTDALNTFLEPLRTRMAHYEAETGLVDEIIYNGTERVRGIARETLREVRKAMGTDGTMKKIRRAVERRQKKLAKEADPFSNSSMTLGTRDPVTSPVVGSIFPFLHAGKKRLRMPSQSRLHLSLPPEYRLAITCAVSNVVRAIVIRVGNGKVQSRPSKLGWCSRFLIRRGTGLRPDNHKARAVRLHPWAGTV